MTSLETPRHPSSVRPCGVRSRAYRANCTLEPGHAGQCFTGVHWFIAGVTVTKPRGGGRKGGPQGPRAPRPPSYSKRARQITWCIANGLTTGMMAKQLDISHHTAKFHVQALMQRFAVSGREQILIKALVEKWMTLEELTAEVMP